jgi:hypothetical protein
MKRLLVLLAAAALSFVVAQPSFAEKICLKDQFGEYYQLKGGRLDKKSYTVKIDVPGFCVVSGHAEVSLRGDGQYALGILTSHDLAGSCLSVRFTAVGDILLNGTGNFDQNGDGTTDGSVTFTNISCTSMPVFFGPNNQNRKVDSSSPFLVKQ